MKMEIEHVQVSCDHVNIPSDIVDNHCSLPKPQDYLFIISEAMLIIVSDLLGHLANCSKVWLCFYITLSGVLSVFCSLPLHLMGLGLIVCVLTSIKLPSPDPLLVSHVLGELYYQFNPREASLVAHRAACRDAPENSVEAVRLAARNGVSWIEFDISFTSDGVAVAFHDDRVDRVTNGHGLIVDHSYEQLQQLELDNTGGVYGAKIPTVEQFVKECLDQNIKVIIDLKTYQRPEETLALMKKLYQTFPTLKQNSIVTSFFPNLLYKLRSHDPSIVTAISTRPKFLSCQSWEGNSASESPRFSGTTQWLAKAADFIFEPLLDSVLWWVLGLSAVLVHR